MAGSRTTGRGGLVMKRLLIVALFLIPVAASAQFRYAAKFVCGKPTGTETGSLAVAPGTYFTAINVHNFTGNPAASLRKRFSFGRIQEQPGAVSNFVSSTLQPSQTMLIDCRELLANLGNPP